MTHAIDDTDTTRLGRVVAPLVTEHPGQAGIHALPDPHGAFAARALLADAAEKAIDAQYYMWHGDITGFLLFERLWRAAERGVRVRLLVDDNNTAGLDETLAALDSHPSLEVRLYNPLTHRRVRALSYVLSPRRIDHRMHNKSFTVDNQVTVVGGRNVGDEYFGAGHGMVFTDLDVLGLGPVVRDVSTEFDRYWNSPSAAPAAGLLPAAGTEEVRRLESRFASVRADPEAEEYLRALRETTLVRELLEDQLTLEWTEAQLVCDDPAKTLDTEHRDDLLLLPRMLELVGRPAKTMDLVSPYFVPMADGTAVFAGPRPERGPGAGADQLPGRDGRGRGPRRVREEAQGSPRGGSPALRAEASSGRARGEQRAGRELLGQPSRQDVRRRRREGLRRLLQLRPALRAPQHGDGPGDRERRPRPGDRRRPSTPRSPSAPTR